MKNKVIIMVFAVTLLFGGSIFDQEMSAKGSDKKKNITKSKTKNKKIKMGKPLLVKFHTAIKPKGMLGAVGDTVPVKATLQKKGNGQPVPGQNLKFYIGNKFINNGKTDSNGVAKVNYKVPKYIGSKQILVKFAGKDMFLKSSGTANFASIKSSTKIALSFLNPNSKAKGGSSISIRGALTRITDKKGLYGREIKVFVSSKLIKRIATNSKGGFSHSYKIPSNLKGNLILRVKFEGDKYYLGKTKSISRKLYAPIKNGYLKWSSASGKVGQTVTVKVYFNKTLLFKNNQGIGGKKVRVWCRTGNKTNLSLGSAYTNSSGIANVRFMINQPSINTSVSAHVDNVRDEYKLIKISKNVSYKVYKSPVKISISGSNKGRIGDTLFYTVIVRNATNNEGINRIYVYFERNKKKLTSSLGSVAVFYKVPSSGGLGLRTITVKTPKTDKYFAGKGTKTINVKPKNN